MNRQRLSWDKGSSAHPATPDEGAASPAYPGKDPEANAYQNGDTSSWAEDPKKGPYPQSAHPATPDEGPASPAYKSAAEKVALEKKASKCIRIATAMLASDATASQIENHALVLMDLPDRAIAAHLERLGGDDEEDEEVEEKEESKKKASERIATLEDRIARLERVLIRLAGEEDDEDEEKEEAKKKAGLGEEDALLEQMLKEEGMFGDTAGAEPVEEACGDMDAGFDVELGGDADMGVLDMQLDPEEQMILAQLYGKSAGEDEEDEEAKKKAGEESDEDEEKEEAKKKASAVRSAAQRPQPKKASAGPKTLGSVSKVASGGGSEIDELSKLWTSAPDVSRHF